MPFASFFWFHRCAFFVLISGRLSGHSFFQFGRQPGFQKGPLGGILQDLLVSGAENGEVLVWDLRMGRVLAQAEQAHSAAVTGVDVSPGQSEGAGAGGGSSVFATASLDCSVKIWDASSVGDKSDVVGAGVSSASDAGFPVAGPGGRGNAAGLGDGLVALKVCLPSTH